MGWATLGGVHGPPDWVMVGTQNSKGGVTVFASTDLTRAELTVEIDNHYDLFGTHTFDTARTYILTTQMRTVVCAQGDDYPEAIRRLFEFWQPTRSDPTPGRARLPEPRRAIDG